MANLENDDLLRGWKEISQFTKLNRNSLRRLGYPIHRDIVNETDKGRIYAFKSEIIEYMKRYESICQSRLKLHKRQNER